MHVTPLLLVSSGALSTNLYGNQEVITDVLSGTNRALTRAPLWTKAALLNVVLYVQATRLIMLALLDVVAVRRYE